MNHSSNGSPQPEKPHGVIGTKRFGMVMLGVGALMSGLFAIGLFPRLHRQTELNAAANEAKSDVLTVNTVTPHRATTGAEMVLPGNIQALQETTLYARATGYLKQRLVDIGDRVESGQLLAEIDTPEAGQDVGQARAGLAKTRANLAQAQSDRAENQANVTGAESTLAAKQADLRKAQADSALARKTWERWQTLVRQGAVSQQTADERQSAFESSQATVTTAQAQVKAAEDAVRAAQAKVGSGDANVDAAEAGISESSADFQRRSTLQAYNTIVAPFSGVITARNVDNGALITAGSGGSNAVWLYKIAQSDTLRIFVDVPQSNVDAIRPGQTALIMLKEFPKQEFKGTVTRTSNSLDPNAHTLRTEVQIPNANFQLLPGMYAQVKFRLNRVTNPLMIPANALVTRSQGAQVAIVGADQKVHYQKVSIGRDYGAELEITSGLEGSEQLVVNPTDDVAEGTKVKAIEVKKPTT